MKANISNAIGIILLISLFWLPISNFIQALICPEMTQTELFLHIFKSFIGDWNYCNN